MKRFVPAPLFGCAWPQHPQQEHLALGNEQQKAVNLRPSESVRIPGIPASTTATAECVVPKSMQRFYSRAKLAMNRWTCPLCRMHRLVTAGATYEPIDEVRRLTNHSTGRLGCALADALQRAGHRVTLLLSETAQHNPRSRKVRVLRFNTTLSLQQQMKEADPQKLRPFSMWRQCLISPSLGAGGKSPAPKNLH